jgi:hypothetical protein
MQDHGRPRVSRTRRIIVVLTALALLGGGIVAVATPASAAPTPGAKCKKVGKVTANGLVCKRKKSGKKVFVRLPAAPAPQPADPPAETPSSPEFTAAEKATITQAFQTSLTGRQVDRTFTENDSLTQLIWHLCPSDRYGLLSNLSFAGSGSTTSTEIGTWRIIDAGGIRDQVEAVLIRMTPDDPAIDPYTLEIAAFADGRVEANSRRAVISTSGEC